ncbi:MAG TPA: thioredoxin family protein [Anaeromyxobacteraceae bacterium]
MNLKLGLGMACALSLAVGPACSSAKEPAPAKAAAAGQQAQAVAKRVPRLVDIGASKCIPCKAMAPILADLKRDYAGKLEVHFIDVWQDRAAAEPYRIGMIPTQIFFAADGSELWRHEGFFSREEILAKWKQLGVKLD